jgi:hypothetical protein
MKLASMIAVAVAICATGCGGSDDGTFQQHWTIQGTTNPNGCTVSDAAQMRIVVVNPAGAAQATSFTSCGAFVMSQSLPPNNYTAAATFLNANGFSVSQTKLTPVFTIVKDQTTTRTIDFSATDFLAR